MERKSAWKKVVTQNNIRWKLLSFTPTTRTKSSNWWREGWQSTYTVTPPLTCESIRPTRGQKEGKSNLFLNGGTRDLNPRPLHWYHIKFHEPSSRTKSPN
jgi:hypothetical protein